MAEAGRAELRLTGYCAERGGAPIRGAMPAAYERLSDHCPTVFDVTDRDLDRVCGRYLGTEHHKLEMPGCNCASAPPTTLGRQARSSVGTRRSRTAPCSSTTNI